MPQCLACLTFFNFAKILDFDCIHHILGTQSIKSQNFNDLIASYPDRIITSAVKGMLPKNKLSNSVIKKLKVYKGESHPHKAQNPLKLEI